MDALPFKVVGVHNRIDLAQRDLESCGELRVTLATLDSMTRPLHLIFLFRQNVAPDDVAPDGTVHCLATARRWGRLSGLDEGAFATGAKELLAESLTGEAFLLAESLERIDPPWEWRQWVFADDVGEGQVFVNPPLFQTLDVPAINAPGPLRDEFLAFVAENLDALAERRQLIPEQFRPLVAHVDDDGTRPILDLSGLSDLAGDALERYPDLTERIELIGCPACHTAPFPEFVQTFVSRHAADFHFHELEFRMEHLDRLNAGDPGDHPLYGPIQPLESLIDEGTF